MNRHSLKPVAGLLILFNGLLAPCSTVCRPEIIPLDRRGN